MIRRRGAIGFAWVLFASFALGQSSGPTTGTVQGVVFTADADGSRDWEAHQFTSQPWGSAARKQACCGRILYPCDTGVRGPLPLLRRLVTCGRLV